MSIVPNFSKEGLTQIRDFNNGGFAQGAAPTEGMYGQLLVGDKGTVFAGIEGANPGIKAVLVMEDALGHEHTISAYPVDRGQSFFTLDPGVKNNIPQGARVSIKILRHSSGWVYWFLATS